MTASELTQSLKTARGKRYYDILKSLRDIIASDLAADFEAIRQYRGGITPARIGVLALHYDVNYKAMIELLEWGRHVKCGLYERIVTDGGVKVGDIFEAARKIEDGPVKSASRYEVAKSSPVES